MPRIFPATTSDGDPASARHSCRYTMLEVVLAVLIIALLSAAAVGVLTPAPEKDVVSFAAELEMFAVSARRRAISGSRDLSISYDRNRKMFICGSEELSVPENITVSADGMLLDEFSAPDTASEELFRISSDGSVTTIGKIELHDQYNTAEIRDSALTSFLRINLREESQPAPSPVPMWLDKERI